MGDKRVCMQRGFTCLEAGMPEVEQVRMEQLQHCLTDISDFQGSGAAFGQQDGFMWCSQE